MPAGIFKNKVVRCLLWVSLWEIKITGLDSRRTTSCIRHRAMGWEHNGGRNNYHTVKQSARARALPCVYVCETSNKFG